MPAPEVAPLPDDIGGLRVEPRGPVTAEMHVDRVVFEHAAWRGIRVDVVAERLGFGIFKQQLVVNDLAARGIDAVDKLLLAVFGRGGEPEAVAPVVGTDVEVGRGLLVEVREELLDGRAWSLVRVLGRPGRDPARCSAGGRNRPDLVAGGP